MTHRQKILTVAPMMDWTDRHCRYFHRQLTGRAVLYTEMLTADAVIHGDREALLGFDEAEQPLVLQLGGSDPRQLARATAIARDFGYRAVNLNVGCPSDRVQSGAFGACLMRDPQLVADCVAAMKEAAALEISVKCRIGVDDQDPEVALDALAQAVWRAGCDALWVHARKAWLTGLSPKENRDVPPLDYGRVYRLKKENRNRFIGLNGGIENVDHALSAIAAGPVELDGAMLGRAAYRNPALLQDVDRKLFGQSAISADWDSVISAMCDYAERVLASGGRLHQVTRHMIGLFQGLPGARRWRRILSVEGVRREAGPEVIEQAYCALGRSGETRQDASCMAVGA
jgi:tRNA-dihydrouridine synthase A